MPLAEVADDAAAAALHAQRCDDVECLVGEASRRLVKRFIRYLVGNAKASLAAADPDYSVRAALPPVPIDLMALQAVTEFWDSQLNEEVIPELVAAWRAAYTDRTDVATGLDEVAVFIAAVNDRLSSTATPSIPEQAFDRIRGALTAGLARGVPTKDIAQRIAAEFSWEPNPNFWRGQLAETDARIDAILDPFGPPGTPEREAVRRSDPVIAELRKERNVARARIDDQESVWQTRAQRIARTESVGALNAGAVSALQAEGVGCMRWLATNGPRTRDSHRQADGQVVRVGQSFEVGGAALSFPGDPRGPAEETINCRCAVVAAECPEV